MEAKKNKCQACDGLGTITYEIEYDPGRPWSDDGPAHEERTIDCRECDSMGVVSAADYAEQTDRGGTQNCQDALIELDEMLR